ncbi:MAG: HD domain-containing protein [Chitinophagales bacterium]|nr:HD domain-containing protein [Chitinophagales bacterium]MDW8427516.1 HD domain-containing protein [Chitinophagales bacterium]
MISRRINKRKIINDPLYGLISIPTDLIYDLIAHPWFQRLSRIRQLGMTYLVYPGALHSRLSHALGAMHLMQQALSVLQSKGVTISPHEAEATTAAILLHDIGHGPFSHTLEGLLVPLDHEQLTALLMEALNRQFEGRLELAVQIFNGTYPRPFLHQLVSGQLDIDRLDYLTRDSFFTGVAEGVIGYDRIIKMLGVHNEQLVVEEKGIYSIEKFLVSRRLMYWQVYLHKTVLAADHMLAHIIRRAHMLAARNDLTVPSEPLSILLKIAEPNQLPKAQLLHLFTQLDDHDIMMAIKQWQHHPDPLLALLCRDLLERRLFRIELQRKPFDRVYIERLRQAACMQLSWSSTEAAELIKPTQTAGHAYNPLSDHIRIRFRDGRVFDVAEVSELLNMAVLREPDVKHYLCYPRALQLD